MTEIFPVEAHLRSSYSFDEISCWRNLRMVGQTFAAKASIAMPILGYLILFQDDVVSWLKLHSSLCENCAVSWRLKFIYFGFCAFAVGSILYGLMCPLLIKRHESAHAYFEAEGDYFNDQETFKFLVALAQKDRATTHINEQYLLASAYYLDLEPSERTAIMSELYFLQNRSVPRVRKTIFLAYTAGSVLLLIPSAWTFGQVIVHSFYS